MNACESLSNVQVRKQGSVQVVKCKCVRCISNCVSVNVCISVSVCSCVWCVSVCKFVSKTVLMYNHKFVSKTVLGLLYF